MTSSLLRDPRVRQVRWKDLVTLRPRERCFELALPLPFLLAAQAAFHLHLRWLGLLAAAYFFLAGLRLVHDAFHANLGLPRAVNHALLLVLSGLMLGSMHAVRLTHLQHHRDCLGAADVEGASARRTAVGALLLGFLFPVALHRAALTVAKRPDRAWIVGELALTALVLPAALASPLPGVRWHGGAMLAAQTFTAFFAVWTVHRRVDPDRQVARTLRHRLKSLVVLGMFFHLEHHLYPRVPTRHLPALAIRLHRRAPHLADARVY